MKNFTKNIPVLDDSFDTDVSFAEYGIDVSDTPYDTVTYWINQ